MLTRGEQARAAAAVALIALLAVYMAGHERLWSAGIGWDVAFVAVVLLPLMFALPGLALPLRAVPLPLLGAGFVSLAGGAAVAEAWGADIPASFLKLAAATALGFIAVGLLEQVLWVAGIAVVVPVIDTLSVWRGPTRHLVDERQDIFSAFSIAFPIPGEHAAAGLGLPDFLFFAVFLASAARWGLRTGLTWVAMTTSFGVTLALAAYTELLGGDGLPALPLLCIAFLAVNGDLLLRRLRAS